MKTPEGMVKDAIKKVLKARGIWFYMPMQNGMGVVGIPDFICCDRGKFLAIEAKAPGKLNNLSANQRARLKELQDHNAAIIVVDDIEQLEEFLNAYV